MKDKITAELLADGMILKYNDKFNSITYDELAKILSTNKSRFESYILPLNCIKFIQTRNRISIALYHPSKQFDAHLYDVTYENCVRPNVIIFFDVDIKETGYHIRNTRMYGIKDDFYKVTENSLLYALPFPNINSEGWICWGSNTKVTEIKSLMQLGVFVDRFFALKFNYDLWDYSFFKAFNIKSVEELFEDLKGRPAFPSQYLIPVNRNNTMTDILTSFL